MKSIFNRAVPTVQAPIDATAAVARREQAPASCLDAPAVLRSDDDRQRVVKVEAALRAGDYIIVAGWSLGPVQACLAEPAKAIGATARFERPDVALHFERPADERHGWVVVASLPAGETSVGVEMRDGEETLLTEVLPLSAGAQFEPAAFTLLGPAVGVLAYAHEPFTPAWKSLLTKLAPVETASSRAHGYLEAAIDVGSTGQAVAVGWAIADAGAVMWLEDGQGGMHPLDDAVRLPRPDVHALFGSEFGGAALASGFKSLLHLEGPAGTVKLRVLTPAGVKTLGKVECKQVAPAPLEVARWLFGIAVTDGAHDQRYDAVAGPLLSDLIARDRRHWQSMPVAHRQLGRPVACPQVSIVVPLYGRFDFVESQMIEWSRDPWIREHAELIYVVDDPAIVDAFRMHAEELHRLYGIPFQWVWGGVNRGFSGANNLGALHSHAPRLLFLNSDVFPQSPGWLQGMVDALDAHPEVGAVGPRLTFAEGGIQHAGMRFERLEEHGVWINRHPSMGLDPALDPARGPTLVPAVTGACILMRSTDFEAVGGWDTGYLVGDFEDSDLCLKLRERGLHSLYLPHVQLTHLERQSMSALGEDAFRMRVTLWNAMRHQRRWRTLIEQAMEACA